MSEEKLTLEEVLKLGSVPIAVAKYIAPEMYEFEFVEETEDEKSNNDS